MSVRVSVHFGPMTKRQSQPDHCCHMHEHVCATQCLLHVCVFGTTCMNACALDYHVCIHMYLCTAHMRVSTAAGTPTRYE